jgi:hypothetical protein
LDCAVLFFLLIIGVLTIIYVNHLVDVRDIGGFRRRRRSKLDPWRELNDSNASGRIYDKLRSDDDA